MADFFVHATAEVSPKHSLGEGPRKVFKYTGGYFGGVKMRKVFVILFFALSTSVFSKNVDLSGVMGYSLPASNVNSIALSESFTGDTSIPLGMSSPVYGFAVSGDFVLPEDHGVVRLVLVDADGSEHLVFEAYPLIGFSGRVAVENVCEETCLLDGVVPKSLRIEGFDASGLVKSISFVKKRVGLPKGAGVLELKNSREAYKVQKMNEVIEREGLHWVAGENVMSRLPYSEKKKLFFDLESGEPAEVLPDLQGFEYYVGGVFEFRPDKPPKVLTRPSDLSEVIPAEWDWRDVHGENWVTEPKNQGETGNCEIFSLIGAMESGVNLYFNQHLDVDLSEQLLVDCEREGGEIDELSGGAEPCPDGIPCDRYCTPAVYGVPDEQCDPYAGRDRMNPPEENYCNYETICSDWVQRTWRTNDVIRVPGLGTDPWAYEFELKKGIVKGGPVDARIRIDDSSCHAMILVGFETNSSDPNPFPKTTWIFKNSYGSNWSSDGRDQWGNVYPFWGYDGYLYLYAYTDYLNGRRYLPKVFEPPSNQSFWPSGFNGLIRCVDADGDGYCNWGVSEEKPLSCALNCKEQKDCDDSNASLLSFELNPACGKLPLLLGDTPLESCTTIRNQGYYYLTRDVQLSSPNQTCMKFSIGPEDRLSISTILDCKGHKISGLGAMVNGTAILVDNIGRYFVEIRNCVFEDLHEAIVLHGQWPTVMLSQFNDNFIGVVALPKNTSARIESSIFTGSIQHDIYFEGIDVAYFGGDYISDTCGSTQPEYNLYCKGYVNIQSYKGIRLHTTNCESDYFVPLFCDGQKSGEYLVKGIEAGGEKSLVDVFFDFLSSVFGNNQGGR